MPAMSCGRNGSAYFEGDYYDWWDYDNGTIVFCDHLIECEASFGADTDIGGWGVSIMLLLP